jgi:hypothetical protein
MSLVWLLLALFGALLVLVVVRAVQSSSRPRWGRTTTSPVPGAGPGTTLPGTAATPAPAAFPSAARPAYPPLSPTAGFAPRPPAAPKTTVGEIALGVALGLWLFTISAVMVSLLIGLFAGWGFSRLL